MESPTPNVRSAHYFIAQLTVDCWFCGNPTRVAALALPPGHEVLEEPAGSDTGGWQVMDGYALVFDLVAIPERGLQHLVECAPGFQQAPCNEPAAPSYANYCEHCAQLLDDQDLHCEPGHTFAPMTAAEGEKIQCYPIHESLEVSAAGYAFEPEFVPLGRRL
jgi:hypothetical protein